MTLRALDPDEEVAGVEVGRREGDSRHLEAVDRAAALDAELLGEAGEGAGRGVLGSEDRGNPGNSPDSSLSMLSRPALPGEREVGCRLRRGLHPEVLMTCSMIALNVGAAAADDFMISGLASVTTRAYSGSSAGKTPASDTMRSAP